MSKIPTLKDVADYAGVSTATVARVIHSNGYVAEDTEKRVRDAIQATNYRVSSIAASLRRQRTYTIGHVLRATFPNTFYSLVALGAEQFAREHNYNILTFNAMGSPELECEGIETFIHRRVDAILFTTPNDPNNVQLALDAGVPVVQVERPVLGKANRVTVDNYSGAVAAMEHLIALGHRRIAFIGQDPENVANPLAGYVEAERWKAYLDTLSTHHLEVVPDYIKMGQYYSLEDRDSMQDGYRLTHQLLELPQPPTAIFATSDIPALGTLQAIHEHRLFVPDDISVIGFDDTYSAFVAPPLTTVRMPMEELGRVAVQMALEQIESDNDAQSQPHTVELATQFIIRKSTGPALG